MNGTAVYTSNYTIPTTRLEKRSDTVILTCNSAGNVLNEETGKTITKHSANTNSQGPVASRYIKDSTVKLFVPKLKSELISSCKLFWEALPDSALTPPPKKVDPVMAFAPPKPVILSALNIPIILDLHVR